MMKLQNRELTWIVKGNWPRREPPILLEDLEKSYHACQRVRDHDRVDIYG